MLRKLVDARAETDAALEREYELLRYVSHELRTPLTSALTNLEVLAAELQGEQAELAHAALHSTDRMVRLVEDLLLLSRADARRSHPRVRVDLGEVLIDVAGRASRSRTGISCPCTRNQRLCSACTTISTGSF